MFDGVLEEHELGFLGKRHVVVVQVVLQDVPDLLCVRQVLVDAVGLLRSGLHKKTIVKPTPNQRSELIKAFVFIFWVQERIKWTFEKDEQNVFYALL